MIADVIQNLKNFNNSKVGIKCLVCFKHVNSSEIDAVVEENNAYHGQCYKDRFKPRCSSCNLVLKFLNYSKNYASVILT